VGALLAAIGIGLLGVPDAARAQEPLPVGDLGVAFDPPPLPAPRYGLKAPASSPTQVRIVPAADGTALYTETWLPAVKDGNVPPARVPVVVHYTPYAVKNVSASYEPISWLVPRGYAVTIAHVRGSGGSGGCIEQTADYEVDDGGRIIEDAGELAPWASGAVGMYGISYPGGTQLATATGPDRERLESLKAIVVGAPVASAYEFYNHDGVPRLGHAVGGAGTYFLQASNPLDSPEHLLERPGCQPGVLAGSVPIDGGYSSFYAARDHTRHLDRLEAATLMVHGSADRRVAAHEQAGLFDAIPASTPHVGLFGVWDHEWPDGFGFNGPGLTSPRKDWERADWKPMAFAWFETHLRGADAGVADWPAVQVQATDGQWRSASTWPTAPGPERVLRLGPDGLLDAQAPTGETTYLETPVPELEPPLPDDPLPGTVAVFTSAPFPDRLELVGAPTLELWVRLLLPDSHITARLEAIDAAGERITFESRTVGARSAQHLAPLDHGRFRQAAAVLPPVGTPVLVPIRFNPIDLAVPAGGHLRLTVAGSSIMFDGLDGVQEGLGQGFQGPSLPSGVVQPVAILHDEAHPSRLVAHLPEAGSRLLDVRERDELGQALGRYADVVLSAAGAAPIAPAVVPDAPSTPSAGTPRGRSLPATGGGSSLLLAGALLGTGLALWTLRRRVTPVGRI
jgi:predicted acyl esterase